MANFSPGLLEPGRGEERRGASPRALLPHVIRYPTKLTYWKWSSKMQEIVWPTIFCFVLLWWKVIERQMSLCRSASSSDSLATHSPFQLFWEQKLLLWRSSHSQNGFDSEELLWAQVHFCASSRPLLDFPELDTSLEEHFNLSKP